MWHQLVQWTSRIFTGQTAEEQRYFLFTVEIMLRFLKYWAKNSISKSLLGFWNKWMFHIWYTYYNIIVRKYLGVWLSNACLCVRQWWVTTQVTQHYSWILDINNCNHMNILIDYVNILNSKGPLSCDTSQARLYICFLATSFSTHMYTYSSSVWNVCVVFLKNKLGLIINIKIGVKNRYEFKNYINAYISGHTSGLNNKK